MHNKDDWHHFMLMHEPQQEQKMFGSPDRDVVWGVDVEVESSCFRVPFVHRRRYTEGHTDIAVVSRHSKGR